jgi:3-oxoadipate enol-lactonase
MRPEVPMTASTGLQSLRAAGRDIAFRIDGEAGLPWLVAAHSLAASHRMWDPQVAALSRHHRVLRYELSGHGASAAPDAAEGTLGRFAADLIALMDALGIDRAAFLGLSLGGAIGLELALAQPRRITRLACCCARADASPDYIEAWRMRTAVVREKGVSAVAGPTLERWFTAPFRAAPEAAATLGLAREMILGTSVAGYAHAAAALQTATCLPRLGQLAIPVLYVSGSEDTAIPPPVMADLQARTPGSRHEVLQDAAHLCNLEQPARFNALVGAWFSTDS